MAPKRSDRRSIYATLLRTTRQRQLDQISAEWKKKNSRKRLKKGGRSEFENRLPPTTIFDFLYRLRIRSNYADADSFLMELDSVGFSALEYNSALRAICGDLCLCLEFLVARSVGQSQYRTIVSEYCRRVGRDLSAPVRDRCECLGKTLAAL